MAKAPKAPSLAEQLATGGKRLRFRESLTPEQQKELDDAIAAIVAQPPRERKSYEEIARKISRHFGKPLTSGSVREWIRKRDA